MSTLTVKQIRERLELIESVVDANPLIHLSEDAVVIRFLLDEVDAAQANIDAAREHLQAVIAEQRYVGTRVQTEAQRALDLLDGEPDGADL